MKNKLGLITLLCLIAGAIFGFFFPNQIIQIEFLGSFYVTILKIMILPVIFTSIVTTVYESIANQGKLLLKTIGLFVLMFVVSFLLASVIVLILNPAQGFEMKMIESDVQPIQVTWNAFFLNLLPKDVMSVLTGKNLLFIILLSYLIGYLAHVFHWESFIQIIQSIKKVVFEVLKYVTYYAPIAVFVLMGVSVYKFGIETLLAGLKYILTAYCAGIVVLVVVMLVPVTIFKKIPFGTYIRKVYPIWLMTVSTCSSAATLPYTIKVCKEDLKLKEENVDMVIPLGCTINMCGGAVSFALLGLFCAKLYGVDITFGYYVMMLVSSLLINMAAPGIPGGGIVVGATYLQGLGIPFGFIGLYNGIYRILDMLYTTLNVMGDVTAVTLLEDKNLD